MNKPCWNCGGPVPEDRKDAEDTGTGRKGNLSAHFCQKDCHIEFAVRLRDRLAGKLEGK